MIPITIEDVDDHAALLEMGTGNAFWICMWRFINTFAADDNERRAWREFLAEWRALNAETQTQ